MIEAYTLILSDQTALSTAACELLTSVGGKKYNNS